MSHYHLGINLSHDRAAALVSEGKFLTAIQQERLDRHKYSLGLLQQSVDDPKAVQLPMEAILYCLEHHNLDLADVDTITANMPGIDWSSHILKRCLPQKVAHKIRSIPSHHLAHAYSAYWPSGFDEAVIVVVDGSGSTHAHNTESYSLYEGRNEKIIPLHTEYVPAHLAELSTLGFLYEYVTRKAGFVTKTGSKLAIPEAGKLMGLAPYGKHQSHWQGWIHTKPRNSSWITKVRASS